MRPKWIACDAAFAADYLVKWHWIVLLALLMFVRGIGRASPPEYLAATREPAETAGEQVSPLDEPLLPLRGWRLAQYSKEPFLRDSILSLEPRFYYRHLDDGNGVHEAFAGGGAMLFESGWWRETLQLGIGGYIT